MRQQPKPQEIHMVINLTDQCKNKGEMWATAYLPAIQSRGSRLKFWQINSSLEIIGEAKTVSWWNSASNHQSSQLQEALGENYCVLEQWETLQAVTDYILNNNTPEQ